MVTIERDNRFHNKRAICKKSIAWAFLFFWIGGFIGVFLDIGHTEKYLFEKLPLKIGETEGRKYNIPMFFVAIGIIIYTYTLIYRLYALVLKKRIKIPILK